MSIEATGLNNFITVHWSENIRLIMTAIINNIEAVDWVRKYLVDASVARGCFIAQLLSWLLLFNFFSLVSAFSHFPNE